MRLLPQAEGSSARDCVLAGQGAHLSDASLLSVVVGESEPRVSNEILASFPIPDGLWRASADELVRHAGVGPAVAARLLACVELSRRASGPRSPQPPLISTPEDVVALCGSLMRGLEKEHFWSLALNTKNRLLRLYEVSVGSLSASIVHPREVFKDAVRVAAASVVLLHNHPSGDATPSSADIQLTQRLVRSGDVLGIEVLDHVVIGDGGNHVSLRESGLM